MSRIKLSDGSSWPLPNCEETAWRLLYGTPTREDILLAVSIMNAYDYLITATNQSRRALVVREIRAALGKVARDDQ